MQDQNHQTLAIVLGQLQPEALNQAMAKYIQAKEAANAAKEIRDEIIALIKPIVENLNIRPDELEMKSNASQSLPPKFRNPETGETWHGQGRRPSWIPKELKTKDIEQFRIKD